MILGKALTKDEADAADLLRACVFVVGYQHADGSFTLQRAREEREAESLTKVQRDQSGDEHYLQGIIEVVPAKSTTQCRGRMRVSFPARTRVVEPSLKARGGKGYVAPRGEHGQHPGSDGGVYGRVES